MSNRVWIDERHYKIEHVRTLDDGTQENFWIEYDENETETTIYITEKLDSRYANDHDGSTGTQESNFPGAKLNGKDVVFEALDGTTTPIVRRFVSTTPDSWTVEYTRLDGSTFGKYYAVGE